MPSSVFVLVVVEETAPPAVVVVVVDSCAKAVLSATAPAAPAANILTNRVCFIFVFFVKRNNSVVHGLTRSRQGLFDRICPS